MAIPTYPVLTEDGVQHLTESFFNKLNARIDERIVQTAAPTSSLKQVPSAKAVSDIVEGINTQLNLKAPIESPTFTGIPSADTAPFGERSTQLATTEFVQESFGNLASPTFSYSKKSLPKVGNWSTGYRVNTRDYFFQSGSRDIYIINNVTGAVETWALSNIDDRMMNLEVDWSCSAINDAGLAITLAKGSDSVIIHRPDGFGGGTIGFGKTPEVREWDKIISNNNLFMAISTDNPGTIFTTTDGVTWNSQMWPNSVTVNCIGWNGTEWFGVGFSGPLGENVLIHGTDLATIDAWTIDTVPNYSDSDMSMILYDTAYSNGRYVVVCGRTNYFATSADGITWEKTMLPEYDEGPTHNNWTRIIAIPEAYVEEFGEVRFLAVAGTHNRVDNYNLLYSKDGVNWIKARLPLAGDWSNPTFMGTDIALFTPGLNYYNIVQFYRKPIDMLSDISADVQAQIDRKVDVDYIDIELNKLKSSPITATDDNNINYIKVIHTPPIDFPETYYSLRYRYHVSISRDTKYGAGEEFILDAYLAGSENSPIAECTYIKKCQSDIGGAEVIYTYSATDGFDLYIKTQPYSVVIIDRIFSEMGDGWYAVHNIREFPTLAEVSSSIPFGTPIYAAETVYGRKARTGTITVPTGAWIVDGDNFTQDITIDGIDKSYQVDITPTPAILGQLILDGCTAILPENNNGTIHLTAFGVAPTVDLDIPYLAIPV